MNENEKTRLEVLKQKIKFFFEKKSSIHINLHHEKAFLNGVIKSISEDFFIINDRRKGEIPVFFLEVYNVEPFVERTGMENDKLKT